MFSTEELQTVADSQHILTPQGVLLRPVGGQPLPHSLCYQVSGGAGGCHLQAGRVLVANQSSGYVVTVEREEKRDLFSNSHIDGRM